jgi:hypothetical protein
MTDPETLQTSDGKPASDGLRVFTLAPPPGSHRCKLAVHSATGEILGSSTVEFATVSSEDKGTRQGTSWDRAA